MYAQITVRATSTAAVPTLFSGWGSIAYTSPASLASEEPLSICTASGIDKAGNAVVAVLDEAPPADGARIVRAREECTFAKPKSMSHGAAAQVTLPPERELT